MNTLSRRQFLRTSGAVAGVVVIPSVVIPGRARAAGPELVPRKMPYPPNDEFGSYEPTITPDGNTIYFARFAGSGDKRVLGTTTRSTATPSTRSRGSRRTARRSTS